MSKMVIGKKNSKCCDLKFRWGRVLYIVQQKIVSNGIYATGVIRPPNNMYTIRGNIVNDDNDNDVM